jgi:lysophosphatidate acyltransferase
MAVQARVPIVPVVIANYTEFYSAKQKRFTPGTLRCRGKNIIYSIELRFINTSIVLPPISTENVLESSADVEKLANECREQMLVALKEITPVPKNAQLKQ